MTIILDTHLEIFIASNATEMRAQLLEFLPEHPDDATLTNLAAAVLDCDTLDVVITRSS